MTDTLAIELYKQALALAYEKIGNGADDISVLKRNAVTARTYCELIIAECAKICRDQGASAEHSYAPSKFLVAQRTAEGCARLIERKFKVE